MVVDAAADASVSDHKRARQLDRANQIFRDACQRGSKEACRQIILSQNWLGLNAPNKPELTIRMKALCDADLGTACYNLGEALRVGFNGFPLDPVQGRQVLIHGCELHDPRACDMVGNMLDSHEITDARWTSGTAVTALYDAACHGGAGAACKTLGDRYSKGGMRDEALAAAAYETACSLAYGDACAQSARHLFADGGSPVDRQRAADRFASACRIDPGASCFEAGSLLISPDATASDLTTARDLVLLRCTRDLYDERCGQLRAIEDRLVALNVQLGPRPAVKIRMASIPEAMATVAREKGTRVTVHFTISRGGEVDTCAADGAGRSLDDAVCAAAKQERYLPALDKNGQPISSGRAFATLWMARPTVGAALDQLQH
jgi:TPR repeat protein